MAKAASKTTKHSTTAHAAPANAMDYREHEQTYAGFLAFTKWSVILLTLLMISMAIGFFGGGGFVGGLLAMIVLSATAWFLL
jgi:hypothetical protein